MSDAVDRREALGLLGAGAVTAAVTGQQAAAQDAVRYPEPTLNFAFQIDVALAPVQEIGTIDTVRRRIVPIIGGTITGPRLTGEVMLGGADWQGVRNGDGFTRVSAHYWLKASDGTIIDVVNNGVRRASPDVMARLVAGEMVSPDAYYFRATPVFEVGPGKHEWLARSVFICVGARLPNKAVIRVYEVG